MLVFVLLWLSLRWEILVWLSQFLLALHQRQNEMSRFIAYFMSLHNYLSDIQWEDIFKSLIFKLTSMVSASFAAATVHRHHFSIFTNRIYKSFESEVNFRQVSNCCKSVLKAGKPEYANKTKESITSLKLGSSDFW